MSVTSIEWADRTLNPWTGCEKVSPGCDHCYAETFAERWRGVPGHAFEHGFDLTMHMDRLDALLRVRKPSRFFVNSMSDVFLRGVPDKEIELLYLAMLGAPKHEFLVLTKRPERMRRVVASLLRFYKRAENVWWGVSIESNAYAWRADMLRETPAAVRWISAEPLLGPLDAVDLTGIDWLVCGGESGHGARPMEPAWARDLRDRCVAAGIPFFLKQLGGPRDKRGGEAAVLDGRRWLEYPRSAGAR